MADSVILFHRAESAIIAALLHDVLDDTSVKADQIEDQFGSEVASMVGKVSQLSSMNQLLRRRRRQLVSNSLTLLGGSRKVGETAKTKPFGVT